MSRTLKELLPEFGLPEDAHWTLDEQERWSRYLHMLASRALENHARAQARGLTVTAVVLSVEAKLRRRNCRASARLDFESDVPAKQYLRRAVLSVLLDVATPQSAPEPEEPEPSLYAAQQAAAEALGGLLPGGRHYDSFDEFFERDDARSNAVRDLQRLVDVQLRGSGSYDEWFAEEHVATSVDPSQPTGVERKQVANRVNRRITRAREAAWLFVDKMSARWRRRLHLGHTHLLSAPDCISPDGAEMMLDALKLLWRRRPNGGYPWEVQSWVSPL